MKHEWKNSSLLQKIVHRHHVNWKQKKRERNPSSRSAHSPSYCPIWNIPGKEVSPVFYFLHFVFVSLILSWIWWVNAHTIWLANFLNVGCHWSISYMIHVKSTLPCSLIFFSLNETKTPSQVAHKNKHWWMPWNCCLHFVCYFSELWLVGGFITISHLFLNLVKKRKKENNSQPPPVTKILDESSWPSPSPLHTCFPSDSII